MGRTALGGPRKLSQSTSICVVAALSLAAITKTARQEISTQSQHAVPARHLKLLLPGLANHVSIYRDTYGIPHIYAQSAPEAYFALGYVHAKDRLKQMELFRRRASGTLAEVFGRAAFDDDVFVRQIGIRHTAEEAWASPRIQAVIRTEIESYCAGINARLAELGTTKLQEIFRPLGVVPKPWTPADALAFPKYMGWDQSGTDTDVWMGMLVDKLGAQAVDELFPIDRPYEIPTVPEIGTPEARALTPDAARRFRPLLRDSRILKDERALEQRNWHVEASRNKAFGTGNFPVGLRQAALELHRRFVSGRFGGAFALGSNNWVIDGSKSATGRPMLASDPHLAFALPSIWYTAHLVAPGLNVAGVTFAGFPYVVIGHNARIAWGLTNMQADAVDYFIETTDSGHPRRYLYKGEWRNVSRREEDVPVRGEHAVHIETDSTVHGPLVTSHGARLALCWTGLRPTFEAVAFRNLNRAAGVSDFRPALKDLQVPALNVAYADVEGNIAIAPHGALPIRKRGFGRVPVDGSSGDYDWSGFIPDDQLPFALNPPQHYLASANGRPAPAGYPYYLGWMWDPSYRTRRIHELLRTHDRISLEQMESFQMDAHDLAAERFVPVLIAAYDHRPFGDERVHRGIEELRRWNFEAIPESIGATIWTAWFEEFRRAVWQDEFDSAGIEHWSGGWGYAGSNERQPELEVLEFITREDPGSPWFDDVRTPEKETRDDILARSFSAAVAELAKTRGANMREWKWGKTNVLRLRSIFHQPELDRGGLSVPGDEFTLGPGANGGDVTGGASWRMVVDLGDHKRSFGMYPGGQSEDPSSPHYVDQVNPWAEGKYLPLYFYSTPGEFRAGEVESVLELEPKTR